MDCTTVYSSVNDTTLISSGGFALQWRFMPRRSYVKMMQAYRQTEVFVNFVVFDLGMIHEASNILSVTFMSLTQRLSAAS